MSWTSLMARIREHGATQGYQEVSVSFQEANGAAFADDEVDLIFQHPAIARDFFHLLRSWHESAKHQKI